MHLVEPELIIRNEAPIVIRLALLGMLMVFGLLYALNPSLFSYTRKLANIPFQRFSWQSEQYIANSLFRISSILSISLVFAVFAAINLVDSDVVLLKNEALNFILLWILIIGFTLFKFLLNKYFFNLHHADGVGDSTIDFHYSINQFFSFIVAGILLTAVFYGGLDPGIMTFATVAIVLLFLIRLFGTILILQNNFTYPLIGVFIYLCTFEIVPMLVAAKVLFVDS